MPQKLHNPATRGTVQLGIRDPISKLDIILSRTLEHLVARHGELGATRGTDTTGNLHEILTLHVRIRWLLTVCCSHIRRGSAGALEDLPPHIFRDVSVYPMTLHASGVPIAAEVDVAILLDEGELQSAHGGDVVV